MVVQHGGLCCRRSTPSADSAVTWKTSFRWLKPKLRVLSSVCERIPLNWLFRWSENPLILLHVLMQVEKKICPASHVQQKKPFFALVIFHLFHFLLCPVSAYSSFLLPLKCLISFFLAGRFGRTGPFAFPYRWKDTEMGSIIALVWAQWKLKFI